MTSLSSSTPHPPSTPSQPNVGLSPDSACFVNFVHLHSAHNHCTFHCVCQYDIFVFTNATHFFTAALCHSASYLAATRCCCYFCPFATILRSTTVDPQFATKEASSSKTPSLSPGDAGSPTRRTVHTTVYIKTN